MSGRAAVVTPAQWSLTVTPVAAALATLCTTTALSGVIDGFRWFGYAGISVIVVMAAGMALRSVRVPTFLVGTAQMVAVLCLVVALFTDSGILGFIPGPEAFGELGDRLGQSVDVVRNGVPPVKATAPLLCLVVIAIGLVAVLVDTLAVAAGTPAASGLVLLCVYAVPASLADAMLPWWSFVLGATSFALLLAVDGTHRHQMWRNRTTLPGADGVHGVGTPSVLVGIALVLGLVAGAGVTAIGTVGQLPGGGGGGGGGSGELGLNPMTNLRGILDQRGNTEMYRVRGLGPETRYLRAVTLAKYDNNRGGFDDDLARMAEGVPAESRLPSPPGDDGVGPTTTIDIEPINSNDFWAPVYGTPRTLRNLPDNVNYDPGSGIVYARQKRKMPRYTEEADLVEPTAADLRSAGTNYSEIDRVYREAAGIDPRVRQLATDITARHPTVFDRARALQQHFQGNGFKYDLRTAPGQGRDALVDFLFNGKTGFCEQYATAMAVLARAAGIPARVAIGFTAGYTGGDYRVITSQDAHAWVEIFFPRRGWVMFDPTPLTDNRTYTPPYMTNDAPAPSSVPSGQTSSVPAPTTQNEPTAAPEEEDPTATPQQAQQQADEQPSWIAWALGVLLLLAIAFTVLTWLAARHRGAVRAAALRGEPPKVKPTLARLFHYAGPIAAVCWVLVIVFTGALVSWWLAIGLLAVCAAVTPAIVRAWRRRIRLHAVHAHHPDAADAAWQELLAESWDRGTDIPPSETVRTTARRLVREHDLDGPGRENLRTVVGVVERSWYGDPGHADPKLSGAVDEVRGAMRRSRPLPWRARLLPRSVLHPPKARDDE
ncbi:uncharacterized protein DUF4129 [Herbihabitans rhizosphaerae]|uniref:Uncharacterized protein DUF4129 n=1 Tax=Herbihabitans rhizosphaerae TaxID=1872711 RepID=A0A4Q7KIN7_9PSEU|nr:DUF3488 and transglutaminase-like domain-containing protein [Herbihabitans rhizosphaerae]RZS34790.1 uncharacterized protein DUF4129 [Herbihabitans rhizosphaerae]